MNLSYFYDIPRNSTDNCGLYFKKNKKNLISFQAFVSRIKIETQAMNVMYSKKSPKPTQS